MLINLSKSDVALIERALDAFCAESFSQSIIGSAMESCITKEPMTRARAEGLLDAARKSQKERQRQCTMLKARIYQAEAKTSEHDLSENPATPPRCITRRNQESIIKYERRSFRKCGQRSHQRLFRRGDLPVPMAERLSACNGLAAGIKGRETHRAALLRRAAA